MLKGVTARTCAQLEKLGLRTLQDLWFHLPLRWEDRTRVARVSELVHGQRALVDVRVEHVEIVFRGRRALVCMVSDGSARLMLRFFHFNSGQKAALTPGTRLAVFGEVRHGYSCAEMVHPTWRRLSEDEDAAANDRLTPVYPTTEGLAQPRLRQIVELALANLDADTDLELLPPPVLRALRLSALGPALRYVHAPPPGAALDTLIAGTHPSQKRLALEELLAHHLSMRLLRARVRAIRAPRLVGGETLASRLLAALPFTPTAAQRRVVEEIRADLAQEQPMLRLVQGDVGAGKTLVAALAALEAVASGCQVALMAPTELLAEQHRETFARWFEPLGLSVEWLSGKLKGRKRAGALERIAAGAEIVIGTHALMQQGVAFNQLGLVIIDEQHRFGVDQRLALRDKGANGSRVPHQLIMTATPIPRTLAMTAYADLDVSVIDELPPGRTPVQTAVIRSDRREDVIARVRAACAGGGQAYWVCTLIESSEQLEAKAAEDAAQALSTALPELRVGLVHGRMKAAEKEAAMQSFKRGEIQLLVATTVIEVGVDVPAASMMIIENAERLGLAQLHQLRGRVGRGAAQSYCVLMYQAPLSQLARERLAVMRETQDGFEIAERDLDLRGPGEVLGTRQTGELRFRVADLARDAQALPLLAEQADWMLEHARSQSEQLVLRWVGQVADYAAA